MSARGLHPDEAALWARVMASVRPLPGVKHPPTSLPVPAALRIQPGPVPVNKAPVAKPARQPGITLDGSWDRKIARGGVTPDSTIDLHGHNLRSAHALLDEGLDHALRRGDRVLLLVTGKPPRPESERPHARGAIRAAIADWIAASRHAGSIAAVRAAHPRHGGAGALYIVLRRSRSAKNP